jgi:hypothetical protein
MVAGPFVVGGVWTVHRPETQCALVCPIFILASRVGGLAMIGAALCASTLLFVDVEDLVPYGPSRNVTGGPSRTSRWTTQPALLYPTPVAP